MLRRLLLAIPTILGISVLTFLMAHAAPGDPISVLVPDYASAEDIARLRAAYGLDQPLPVQFWTYLVNLAHGNWGTSIRTGRPILEEIFTRFPATVELTVVALLVAVAIGVTAGTIAAVRRGSAADYITMLLSMLWVAMPSFVLALLLQLLFANKQGLPMLAFAPSSGRAGPVLSAAWWASIALPAFTLGARAAAILARLTRSSVLDVLRQDYVRTARAKGLQEWTVIIKHALRNAMIPVVTVLGLQLGGLLGGAFLTEIIFAWPGVGRLGVTAVFNRDLPLIQGTVLLVSIIFVGVNLLVDLSYSLLDPKVKYS
ncbi:MAG: Dipeptide transport system permease protein DppB [Firmicutes bacterium]|nr:Dipeptide transport system permease protein DppB [Bacillota bacterium]